MYIGAVLYKEGLRYMILFRYLIFFCYSLCGVACAQVVPLPNAHAHNDYAHQRPLLDALEHGFTSLEADVLLIDQQLYVGHDLPKGDHSLPTLQEAYLQPLDSIIAGNGGRLYRGYEQPCYLMIDIKTEAEATYDLLREQLDPYKPWLTLYQKGQTKEGVVTIFISGNRPKVTIRSETERLVGVDGRPEDLGKGYSVELMPVVSQSYGRYSKWSGDGEMPLADRQRIEALAEKVHAEGKKLRLWATPEGKLAWGTLQSLGVDLINTDDLEGLRDFLLERQ